MDQPEPTGRRPRSRTALLIALVTTAALLVTAANAGLAGLVLDRVLSSTSGESGWPGADDPPGRTITWHDCRERELKDLHAQCGYLIVPLDRAAPDGATVRLAVSRLRHTAAEPQGVMIVNPGGPGGSGVDTVRIAADLPAATAGLYDWVGFDPRGVGDSRPALRCDDHAFEDRTPGYSPTAEHVADWTERARSYAKACERNGPLLRHMTTADSAEDVEALRIALGADTISYYGFSYGTYLGQVYATLHPDRVRRMVLDSTEDPRLAEDEYGFGQDAAFETAMRRFFSWVATWDDVYRLGSTGRAVRDRFDAVAERLEEDPAGYVGPAEWTDVFLDAAYSQADWPDLADVLVEQVRHPSTTAAEDAYDDFAGSSDNGAAAYLAVQCTDAHVDRSLPSILRSARRTAEAAPFATWGNTWSSLPCAFWPAPSGAAIDVDGSAVRSVLMIDETLDAPTPYAGSLRVRDLFPGARLVAEPGGTSHAQSPDADAPCVLHRIVRYLTTGELPPRLDGRRADATCAPAPEPVPNSG